MSAPDDDYKGWGRDDNSRAAFRRELQEMTEQLGCFPSIVMWIPFNEYWGQFDAAETAQWVKQTDPTRLVNNASGFHDQGAGDVYDLHIYMKRITRIEDPLNQRVPVLGEFGARGWVVNGHHWSDKTFCIGKPAADQAEFQDWYTALMRQQIAVAIDNWLAASVYTQLSDVEIEVTTHAPIGRRGGACAARTFGEPSRQMQTLRGPRHTGEACLAPTHPPVCAPIPNPGRSRGASSYKLRLMGC